jgi:hypothetical protein
VPHNDVGTGKLELFLLAIKSEQDATTIERRVARMDGILSIDVNAITKTGIFRYGADVVTQTGGFWYRCDWSTPAPSCWTLTMDSSTNHAFCHKGTTLM